MRQVDFCVSLYTILTERDETKRIVIERESYSTRHSDAGNGQGAAFSQVCWIELLSPSAAGRWDVKKKTCRSPTGPLLQAGHRWQWTNDSVWASSTITAGPLIEWLDGMRADPARHITWEREKSTLTDRRRRTCIYTCRTLLPPYLPLPSQMDLISFSRLELPNTHTHTFFIWAGLLPISSSMTHPSLPSLEFLIHLGSGSAGHVRAGAHYLFSSPPLSLGLSLRLLLFMLRVYKGRLILVSKHSSFKHCSPL